MRYIQNWKVFGAMFSVFPIFKIFKKGLKNKVIFVLYAVPLSEMKHIISSIIRRISSICIYTVDL